MGAQAIVGTFFTVATSVAEAEAHIASVQERFGRRATKMWITLPTTNPFATLHPVSENSVDTAAHLIIV
jgi:hypothetical protein